MFMQESNIFSGTIVKNITFIYFNMNFYRFYANAILLIAKQLFAINQ